MKPITVMTRDPLPTDDVNSDFGLNSQINNSVNGKVFLCKNPAAGAAVWVEPGTWNYLSGVPSSFPPAAPFSGLQTYKTTLAVSQTIAAGERADVYGPITIPPGITLTVNGFLKVWSDSYLGV